MTRRISRAALTAVATTALTAGALAAAPSSLASQAPPDGGGGCSSNYIIDSQGKSPSALGDGPGIDITLYSCSTKTQVVNVFAFNNPTQITTSLFTTVTIKPFGSVKVSIPWYKAFHYAKWYAG